MSSSDNSPSPKMYLLMSSEGETFEVEESVAVQSETIKHMIEVDCTDPLIPLPNVMSKILVKIIEYCKRHVDAPAAVGGDPAAAEAALKAFDADFIKLDKETLFDLILAANYLNVKNLLDLACQNVADHMIKGKSTDEIRQTFNIKNDFTPEEEAELRSERTWTV